jgi:hypothetical protein
LSGYGFYKKAPLTADGLNKKIIKNGEKISLLCYNIIVTMIGG